MKSLITQVVRYVRLIRAFFPEALPVGMSAFDAWAGSIQDLYCLPTQDSESIRFALSAALVNLGSTTAYKSKFYFYLVISSAATKQVAGEVFYTTKMKQMAAAKAAQQLEATKPAEVASNDQPKQSSQ